jgi:hypothetical protein
MSNEQINGTPNHTQKEKRGNVAKKNILEKKLNLPSIQKKDKQVLIDS